MPPSPSLARAIACSLALVAACRAPAEPPAAAPPPVPGFYFWRTSLELGEPERAALSALSVRRLYLRLFDVAWSTARGAPERVGVLRVPAPPGLPADLEVVPVVFLEHQVLAELPARELPALAATLDREVAAQLATLAVQAAELQLDCDWTERTRAPFFALLTELRRLVAARAAAAGRPPPRLSATIRLHQVKYRERTGVPPVDRGMLMYYNMGRFSSLAEDRALFDGARAARYLARLPQYPLPLDVALPIWAWTLHLRDGEVIDLLQSTDPEELSGVAFLRRSGHDRYVATETAFFRGALLRAGDELKGERLTDDELAAAAAQVWPLLPSAPEPRALVLFDLSERNLRRHERSRLEQLFRQPVR